LDEDDGLLGAGEPRIFEFELFSTDANAFDVLEGVEDINVSEDDGKVNVVFGGVVVWLVDPNRDEAWGEIPKGLVWAANELLELFIESDEYAARLAKLLVAGAGELNVEPGDATLGGNNGGGDVPFVEFD
jgi:hypothetical protein